MILKKIINRILLSLMFWLVLGSLYSQDIVNPPAIQTVIDAQTGIDPLIQKNQNRFILGWNWGSPCKTIDEALKINAYHNFPLTSTDVAPSMRIINPPGNWNQEVIGGRNSNRLSNSHSIHLEPTLPIDAKGDVIPRAADNTQSVFGFKYKNLSVGRIPTSVGGVDLQRFVLNKYAVGSTPVLVLNNIWDGKILRWLDYAKQTSADSLPIINENEDLEFHSFNGKQLYLSINLRAVTPSELDANLNNVILTLRLKYKKETRPLGSNVSSPAGEGFIKFYRIPQTGQYEVESIRGNINNDERGTARRMMTGDLATPTTSFQITGAMLKNYLRSAPNNSITLSAFAYLTGKKNSTGNYINNPVLKNDWWKNYGQITEYISEFDVEVDYHGKVDVAIDWIRIETPRAQTFLRGGYDAAIKEIVDWTMDQARANSATPKISRFYGNDELLPSEWQAMHYYNKLIDGLLAIEFGPSNPAHQSSSVSKYLYNTGSSEMWSGSNVSMPLSSGVPYYKKGNSLYNTAHLGNYFGYGGNNEFLLDSLNSEYESVLLGYNGVVHVLNKKPFPIPSFVDPYILNYPSPNTYFEHGTLFTIEKQIHFGYNNQKEMLFDSKPWWANLWINSESWMVDTNSRTFSMYPAANTSRPKTGEEIRLATNLPTILGAKGLMYWFKKTEIPFEITVKDGKQSSSYVWLGLLPRNFSSTNLTGDELVLSDIIGGDYVKTVNDPNGFTNYFVPSVYSLNDLGVASNRIYIGLKSTRFEIMKLNKWIDRIESNKIAIPSLYQESLMDLRLVAWKGKGFTTMENQDPTYMVAGMSSGISTMATLVDKMNLYIKKDQIRTAKLWQPNGGSLNNNYRNAEVNAYVNHWEDPDSSFYDVTILRPQNFAIGDLSRFYIGVQNRRTDPLVWDISTNPGKVKFYSTAEYYEGCHSEDYNTRLYFMSTTGRRWDVV